MSSVLSLIDRFMRWLYGNKTTIDDMPSIDNTTEIPLMTELQKIYSIAKESIGTHMTLDESVPISVGCAEAVSKVLWEAGLPIPAKGIPGTFDLLKWLETNLKEVDTYTVGAVIISATGTGNGRIRGHTGICAQYGILSNESQTGLLREQWDIASWTDYYGRYGGFPIRYFIPIEA